jgi:hypothetical protein
MSAQLARRDRLTTDHSLRLCPVRTGISRRNQSTYLKIIRMRVYTLIASTKISSAFLPVHLKGIKKEVLMAMSVEGTGYSM